ncbi:MAG: hypothetical protein FWD87_00355 [Spirochaetaceae bacterium]|nr:hypothetical protein [Spirochaetaceae bacterium]
MNLREGLGFKYLSHREQQAYKGILQAFSLMAASFDCSQINRSVDLVKVIQTVLGDNPSIIYFNKTQIKTEESIRDKRIILTGVHSKPKAEKMNLALDAKANQIISSVKATSNDEYSLLINLYHFLQKNIQYDKKELQANSRGVCKSPASHNAYGALLNRLAVCDGFSSAFALLAQKIGFECMLVVGHSAYSTSFSNHAWNIIKIQDRFYHVDVTWDARKYIEFGEYSYAYFAMKDDEIVNDHKWDKKTTPACSYNDFSYYSRNGLYINNEDQLNQIINAYARKQPKVFRIKLSRNIPLPKNAEKYLAQKIMNETVKFVERIQISYGWNENARCFFAKIVK